jgi:ferric-dicitrate binding protein FerR (iron transport regulator)
MTETEFQKLIQKHLAGKTSVEEDNLVEEFLEKMKKHESNIQKFDSNDSRDRVRNDIWKDIELGISKKQRGWSRKTIYNLTKVAALLLIMISTGLLYWNFNRNGDTIVIPKDAITLELDDGTKMIIDESSKQDVLDINGNVVGKQNGTEMHYVSRNSEKELRYNKLTVPYGKKFDLTLSDGTVARLNSGTSLRYPVEFIDGLNREVFVTGEVYLQVAKDSINPFLVAAQNMKIEVLGTEFNILAHPEDDTAEVVLVEGSIGLSSTVFSSQSEKKDLLLTPGHMASFDKESGDIQTKEVITDVYTAWLKGELVFRNMTFESILRKLERHYDVKITNENLQISEERYDASFRKVPIEVILNNFRDYHGIAYEINGNQITIKQTLK